MCEASRVWTADGTASDAGRQAEPLYRLTPLVTTLPTVPGMLVFMEVLRQAEATRNATMTSSAFINKLALSVIAEYAVRVTLASGLLRQSNGCVVFHHRGGFGGVRHSDHLDVSAGGGRGGKYTADGGDGRRLHARNRGPTQRHG